MSAWLIFYGFTIESGKARWFLFVCDNYVHMTCTEFISVLKTFMILKLLCQRYLEILPFAFIDIIIKVLYIILISPKLCFIDIVWNFTCNLQNGRCHSWSTAAAAAKGVECPPQTCHGLQNWCCSLGHQDSYPAVQYWVLHSIVLVSHLHCNIMMCRSMASDHLKSSFGPVLVVVVSFKDFHPSKLTLKVFPQHISIFIVRAHYVFLP